MGKKGDRASKETKAMEMYAYGLSLADIAVALDISVTSLTRWKHATKDPNRPMDEWDLARTGSRDHLDMLESEYKKQLVYFSGLSPRERTPKDTDMLAKLSACVMAAKKFELEKISKLMAKVWEQAAKEPTPAELDQVDENPEPKIDPMEEIKRVYYG